MVKLVPGICFLTNFPLYLSLWSCPFQDNKPLQTISKIEASDSVKAPQNFIWRNSISQKHFGAEPVERDEAGGPGMQSDQIELIIW